MFQNMAMFYGEELLSTSPKPQDAGPPLIGRHKVTVLIINIISDYGS
jgi:hypothetical protein